MEFPLRWSTSQILAAVVTYLTQHEPTPPYAPSNPRASLIPAGSNQTRNCPLHIMYPHRHMFWYWTSRGVTGGGAFGGFGVRDPPRGSGQGEHSEGRLLINSTIPHNSRVQSLQDVICTSPIFGTLRRNSDFESGSLVYSFRILRYYSLSPTLDPTSQ
jgi:hypothetical protein